MQTLVASILFVALGAYAVAYRSMMTPKACLYAFSGGVLRLRFQTYQYLPGVSDWFFAPALFADQLIRGPFWFQKDVTVLQREDAEWAEYIPLVEKIGALGALLTWDSRRVAVSFLGRSVSDDALAVFQEFVLVDDLDLRDTGISDAGLQHLTGLKRLRRVCVEGTQVTDEAIEKFKLSVPNCIICN